MVKKILAGLFCMLVFAMCKDTESNIEEKNWDRVSVNQIQIYSDSIIEVIDTGYSGYIYTTKKYVYSPEVKTAMRAAVRARMFISYPAGLCGFTENGITYPPCDSLKSAGYGNYYYDKVADTLWFDLLPYNAQYQYFSTRNSKKILIAYYVLFGCELLNKDGKVLFRDSLLKKQYLNGDFSKDTLSIIDFNYSQRAYIRPLYYVKQ